MEFFRRFLPLTALLMVLIMGLSGCSFFSSSATPTPFVEKPAGDEDAFIGIPNPASFYCQEMGYTLELRETEDGTQGICIMPDGKECEEWEFLSGGCAIEWTFCQRQGYNISEGDNIGTCTFPDGSSCPEYDFFIQECTPPK